VIGRGADETVVASDPTALLAHTQDHVVLEDGELAVLGAEGFQVVRVSDGGRVDKTVRRISWVPSSVERGPYPNFMRKEIEEQPQVLECTLRALVDPATSGLAWNDYGLAPELARLMRRVTLVGCGSSYHAALVGKAMIERLAGIPAEVDVASEFRYRAPLIGAGDVVVAISQSGETADTLAAVGEARAKGATILAICNVAGSTLERQADGLLATAAGPEIGVASTKAFTAQVLVLYLLALWLAGHRERLGTEEVRRHLDDARRLPNLLRRVLQQTQTPAERVAAHALVAPHALFLGRGLHYPIALEGALKLKELSYIHAEGYPAGEMKHGPIALVDREMPVVFLMPRDQVYDKMCGNLEEIRARDGRIIAVTHDGETLGSRSDYHLTVPDAGEWLTPLLMTAPLQLLAYYAALQRGCDVDKPRNLAKSVTVE
jgi:glucosamine--fructose-6-phosphate aminotransferase (isomerizing)